MKRPREDEDPGPAVVFRSRQRANMEELRATVGPKHNIILTRIVPALEEVEKKMPGLNVDVSRIRSTEPPSSASSSSERARD